MNLPQKFTGQVRCIVWNIENQKTEIDVFDMKEHPHFHGCASIFKNGRLITDDLTYIDAIDAYVRDSDDGQQSYLIVHVLSTNATDTTQPILPKKEDLSKSYMVIMPKLVESLSNGDLDPDDFSWANRVLQSPVSMYSLFVKNGNDIIKAQKDFIQNTLRISV